MVRISFITFTKQKSSDALQEFDHLIERPGKATSHLLIGPRLSMGTFKLLNLFLAF